MWTSWGPRCGVAAYTASLVEALRRREVEVEVVDVPYTDREPDRTSQRLARLNAADLVHVQHEYTFWGGIAPGSSSLPAYYRRLRPPRVVTAHTVNTAAELLRVETEQRPRQRVAKRLLAALPTYRASVERAPFAGAAAVIVHTGEARDHMARRGIRAERVHVIPAGIPLPAAEPAAEEVTALRARWGLGDGRVLTIFGFVNPDKGYEVALAALPLLPAPVKLLIAGGARVEREQPYLEALRAGIREKGLENRVTITGYLEEREIAAAMALSDLVLVPHTSANGSYSVMIALSHGKPVLASDLACFRELREASGAVELFDSEDETALAERAGFLLASAGTRRRMADAALAYAGQRSWDAVAERTLTVYRRALGL